MFTRLLKHPDSSILLLGPRGTGKSTWIKQIFSNSTIYDLLNSNEALRLSKDPSQLYRELLHLPAGSWVILDEVQKVPQLLDEVQRLIEDKKLKFVLSGSSARKLKKGGANLLAGRALMTHMFSLASAEVSFNVDASQVVQFGMLPMAYTSEDPRPYLKTYADIYLQEEIKAEALTRNIGGFGRFLEIAARQNGQVTNVSNISRDAMVARQTVSGFFEILIDTLIGYWLYPWKLKRATRQIAHPKFYFFDTGVARALSGRLPYPPTSDECGPLFETFILNEVRSYLSYSKIDYPIYFWSSHDGVEIDVICETKSGFIALEIKSSSRWDKSFNKGFSRISEELGATKISCYGVYTGERRSTFDNITVLPLKDFLRSLWSGEIIT